MIKKILSKLKLKKKKKDDLISFNDLWDVATNANSNLTSSFAVDSGVQLDQMISKRFHIKEL